MVRVFPAQRLDERSERRMVRSLRARTTLIGYGRGTDVGEALGERPRAPPCSRKRAGAYLGRQWPPECSAFHGQLPQYLSAPRGAALKHQLLQRPHQFPRKEQLGPGAERLHDASLS